MHFSVYIPYGPPGRQITLFFYDPVKVENLSHNRSHFCLRLPAKIQFSLDRKRQSHKQNRFRWFDFQTSYMSLYTSDYDSGYNSVATAENYPLEVFIKHQKQNLITVILSEVFKLNLKLVSVCGLTPRLSLC